jgi:hypothetical protein
VTPQLSGFIVAAWSHVPHVHDLSLNARSTARSSAPGYRCAMSYAHPTVGAFVLAALVVLSASLPVAALDVTPGASAGAAEAPLAALVPTGPDRSSGSSAAALAPAISAGIGTDERTADAVAPAAASHDLDAEYDVDLFLDWQSRRLNITTTIDVLNTSGAAVDRLHLNTIAAKLGSMRKLRATVDGVEVTASRDGQTITVPLIPVLGPGASTQVRVKFNARLLTTSAGRGFLFSKRNGIAHMYRFIPWLSRRIKFGSNAHGEPFLTPSSKHVRVTVDSDRKLKWATSGRRVARSGTRKTFLANNVRDFNIAASPSYRTATAKSKNGATTIVAYTRTIDARRLVNLARTELARYGAKTGIPYPHPTYRIAESGGGLAMESPGLIWIPGARAAADHPFLVSHETAHQWFYGIVGNDQATDAFADEALADYYSRKAHLSLRPSRCKTARLDLEIRKYSSACYFEVIYVQGARFLDSLRRDFGAGNFKRAVRAYASDNRDGIGSNEKLLDAMRERMGNGVVKRFKKRFPSLY